MSFLAQNLVALKKHHPQLYKKVSAKTAVSPRIDIVTARSSDKTVRAKVQEYGREKQMFIHSSFNPVLEAQRFAAEQMREQKQVNFLYGFGLGYHVQEMARLLAEGNMLSIYDINLDVFQTALQLRGLSDVLANPMVQLIISDDMREMAAAISDALNSNSELHLITHVPSLNATEDKYDELKYLLQELNLRNSVEEKYCELLKYNYLLNKQNIKDNVGVFFDQFKGLPIIIVSAGPSLDGNKHLLKGLEDKAIIICVSHALKALIKMNVKPHFIITIDPQPITLKMIEGLEYLDIPFILLATAEPKNAKVYQGPKFIACQHPDYLNPGEEGYLIKTGGSVSTTALDIAIRMGGNPIVYIGQDLGFTGDKHHCEDSFHKNLNVKPLDTRRRISGWYNTEVSTTLGMLSFKRWIQSRIRNEHGITFINSTEGGALIEGFLHLPFSETITKYLNQNFNVSKTINSIIKRI